MVSISQFGNKIEYVHLSGDYVDAPSHSKNNEKFGDKPRVIELGYCGFEMKFSCGAQFGVFRERVWPI